MLVWCCLGVHVARTTAILPGKAVIDVHGCIVISGLFRVNPNPGFRGLMTLTDIRRQAHSNLYLFLLRVARP